MAPNPTYRFTAAFFEELAAAGVQHVCVSPGSRSTPLTVSAAAQAGLRSWVHIDERSAGFFALGLAKATRLPVALICTSGTAAANYLPAIVEAYHGRVPLIVLTADRPPELRDWDAGQTIDQLKLYGDQVRWFSEVPVPGDSPQLLRTARSLACRSVAEARGHAGVPGPVHLNWPLREPLDPVADGAAETSPQCGAAARPHTVTLRPPAAAPTALVDELSALSAERPRGLIACGPLDVGSTLSSAIVELAHATGWPVIADPASNLRGGFGPTSETPIVASGDFLLRNEPFAERHRPDVVLRFGSAPVSKTFRLWLDEAPPKEVILVDPYGGFSDPDHLASRVLAVDPEALCRQWSATHEDTPDLAWLRTWRAADDRAAAALETHFAGDTDLLEPRAVRELCDALPESALLYVSNSMPIRYLDACMPRNEKPVRVLVNRGANGIDGMVSSAFGAAAGERGQTVLLTGDLALVHDLGGLIGGQQHRLKLTIVVLDNNGGGIFSHLPIARYGDSVDFERLFHTPHGLEFEGAARLFGAAYHRVGSVEHYRAALKEAFAAGTFSIVHVPIDRDASIEQFRALAAAVSGVAIEERA